MQANSQGLVYSAEVLDRNDQPFPKVVHQNTTYIIGTAGEAFHIRARVCYRKASPLARPEKPQFKIYAKVDGESVGYTKICYAADNICGKEDKLSDSVVFWGRAGGPGLKHNFTFARPERRASNAPGTRMLPADESAIGTIVLRFREAKSCGPGIKPAEENAGARLPGKGQGVFVVDGGERKPIMMPSLMAGSDQVLKSHSRRERAEAKAEGKYSTVDLTCRFETADVLKLRKILDPEVPAHAAILESARAKAHPPPLGLERTPPSTADRHVEHNGRPSWGAAASASSDPPDTGGASPGDGEQVSDAARISDAAVREILRGEDLREVSENGVLEQCREKGAQRPDSKYPDGDRANGERSNCKASEVGGGLLGGGRESSVNAPLQEGARGGAAHESPFPTTAENAHENPSPSIEAQFRSGTSHPVGASQTEANSPNADWAFEMNGYDWLRVPRTRWALNKAAREGRGPLSLSSVKKRATEREGIHTEKRKKAPVPKEKVTIDLTAASGGDELAYMAVVEKLPAPGVVRID